jgi:hypothetical protein
LDNVRLESPSPQLKEANRRKIKSQIYLLVCREAKIKLLILSLVLVRGGTIGWLVVFLGENIGAFYHPGLKGGK